MMSMAMDKGEGPAVEVGQLREWKPDESQRKRGPFTVETGRIPGQFLCRYVADGQTGLHWTAGELERQSVIVVAPSPSSPGRPAMEAGADGEPVRCIGCGGEKAPAYRSHVCEKCSPVGDAYTDDQRDMIAAWKAGARDFPRSSTQGEPGARRSLVEQVREPCDCCGGEPHDAAPVLTSKPLREVYAGGAWLDYERLSDPDPFHLYKRRRENGVEAAVVEPRGYGGLTFSAHRALDLVRRRVEDRRTAHFPPAPVQFVSQPWLATDTKPREPHPYSKPSSPGGGE